MFHVVLISILRWVSKFEPSTIIINLGGLERNWFWQVAKPATASSLNLWGRVHFWRNLKLSEIMIFCEFCKFANFWTRIVRLRNIMLKICSNLGWGYLQKKRVKLCADHPANIDRAEGRFWSKCARPSLIPPVPPAFVSQLGSWGHASASILIITISILLSCMRSNDAIRDLPRLLLVYARRQAMPCEASPNGIYVFLIIDQSR